jgi:hypothetical protein
MDRNSHLVLQSIRRANFHGQRPDGSRLDIKYDIKISDDCKSSGHHQMTVVKQTAYEQQRE